MSVGSIDELVKFAVENVNRKLKEYFNNLRNEVDIEAAPAKTLVEVAEDYTLRGGKRLRALLALIGYWSRTWGKNDLEKIAKVMTAIELLQSYLLVHDDVMDKDELRRGGPTAHVIFARICRERGWKDCDHYGISQAVVSGDYLEASAVFLLAETGVNRRALSDLLSKYSRGLRKVAYGQYLDLMYSRTSIKNVKEADVFLVYKLKTSSYTIELPLHLGAIVSEDYNEELLSELTNYAIPAGMAFQARDDIIGLYGDPSITGKPVGSDVKSKKKTLLIIKAYDLADEQQKRFLELIYDQIPDIEITVEHVESVRRIVRESGGLKYCEELINNLVKNALKALDDAKHINENARKVLRELTLKLAFRER